MTVKGVLLSAAKLLETKGWTKGEYAINAKGEGVQPTSRSAAKFCIMGAIGRYCDDRDLTLKVERELGHVVGMDPITWNDTQKSKRPVIAALRKAAALCK